MTLRFRFLLVALVFVSLLGGQRLLAQGDDTPLDPSDEFPRIGGEIGLSSVWQSGEYDAGCGHFVEGARLNFLVAAAYDRPAIPGTLRLEALLGIEGRGVRSTYNSRENIVLTTGEDTVRAAVDFENVGTASFTHLFLQPGAKYYVTKGLYVGAGLRAGLVLSATTQYTKNILSKTVTVPGLGLSEVYYPAEESSDPYSKVFEEEDRPDAAGFALDGVLMAGVEIRLSRKLKVGPRVMYTLPFLPVFSNPDLKLNSLEFTLGVRYNI